MVRRSRQSAKKFTITRTIVASSTGTNAAQDAVQSILGVEDVFIIAINATLNWQTAAANDGGIVELSFSGNYQADTNDNSDSIMIMDTELRLLTSGGNQQSINSNISGIKIPWYAGDKLYVNVNGTDEVYEARYVLHLLPMAADDNKPILV